MSQTVMTIREIQDEIDSILEYFINFELGNKIKEPNFWQKSWYVEYIAKNKRFVELCHMKEALKTFNFPIYCPQAINNQSGRIVQFSN